MRIYEQIKEGYVVLRRCQGGCNFWYLEAELCTNEETFKLQCAECYMFWQAEQEDEDFDFRDDDDLQDSSSFGDEDI